MGLKGNVVINAYKLPVQSVNQANRLKAELENLGVEVNIISNESLRAVAYGERVENKIPPADFVIYLDKDKYFSNVLDKKNVRTFNSHNSIRVCDDKGETVLALSGKGFNLPKTIFGALCYSASAQISTDFATWIERELSFPLVAKESFGSMGKGVYLISNRAELLSIMEQLKLTSHIFQEYLPYKKGTDIRVIVIGGRVVASMQRENKNDFRSNIALGGVGKKIELSKEFKDTAEGVAKELGLDYCGIDLLYGKNGEPYICEVNSNAFFEEIEKITGVNVARAYAEHIVKSTEDKKS